MAATHFTAGPPHTSSASILGVARPSICAVMHQTFKTAAAFYVSVKKQEQVALLRALTSASILGVLPSVMHQTFKTQVRSLFVFRS